MLLFFLLVGRTLDHVMRRKTRAVAGNLAALKAETAHRFAGDVLVSVPVAALKTGDRVLVKPGERVPVDGVVVGGLVRDRRQRWSPARRHGARLLPARRSMPAASISTAR